MEITNTDKSLNSEKYECPAKPTCFFKGHNILEHCQKQHPLLIVEHPYTTLPNIKKDNQVDKIFVLNGFVFLLQIKCKANDRILHCIRLLDDPKLIPLFHYTVKYTSIKGSIEKNGYVQKTGQKFDMNDEASCSVYLSSLSQELGRYNNLKFIINLQMIKTTCYSCQRLLSTSPIIYKHDNFYCANCQVTLNCKYSANGCRHLAKTRFELIKHEEFYCMYSNRFCDICETSLREESWFYHRNNYCNNSRDFLIDSNIMKHDVLKVDEIYSAILMAFETKFQCEWRVGKFGNIHMTVCVLWTADNQNEFLYKLKFHTMYDTEINIEFNNNLSKTAEESELEDVIFNNKYNMLLEILLVE